MKKSILSIIVAVSMVFLLYGCSSVTPSDESSENLDTPETSNETSSSTTASEDTPFLNEYGSSTTICAHPGCKNTIASTGDTNCCTIHSNRCLKCGKYIDEDATYCMDCVENSVSSSSGSNSDSYDDYYDDDYDYDKGYGYTAPEQGQSFSDYVKDQDPELYDELQDIFDSLD